MHVFGWNETIHFFTQWPHHGRLLIQTYSKNMHLHMLSMVKCMQHSFYIPKISSAVNEIVCSSSIIPNKCIFIFSATILLCETQRNMHYEHFCNVNQILYQSTETENWNNKSWHLDYIFKWNFHEWEHSDDNSLWKKKLISRLSTEWVWCHCMMSIMYYYLRVNYIFFSVKNSDFAIFYCSYLCLFEFWFVNKT